MTKSELIKRLAKKYNSLYHKDIELLVELIFQRISTALENDERVELRGFGAFSLRKRKSRTARNPKTSEMVKLGDRSVPYFRPGKELRDRVNKAV